MRSKYAPTSPDIAFKRCLLAAIENLTGSKQEDNGIIACQVSIGKNRGIFCKVDRKVMFDSQLLQSYLSILDRGMAESARLRKNEQPPLACASRRRTITAAIDLLSTAIVLSLRYGTCRFLSKVATGKRQKCDRKH